MYLKYDKKLFLQIKDFEYENNKLDLNLTIESNNSNLILNLDNIVYKNENLKLSGNISLNNELFDTLSSDTNKNFKISNFTFSFDDNLPPVISDQANVLFNKDVSLTFLNPTIDGIAIDKSTVDILNIEKDGIVKIDLYTKHILDKKFLEIIGNYEIELPLRQLNGSSNTNIKIDIPFSDDPTEILVTSKMKNSVVLLGDNGVKIKKSTLDPTSKVNTRVIVSAINNTLKYDDYNIKSNKLDLFYNNDKVFISSKNNEINSDQITVIAQNLHMQIKNKELDYSADIKDNKLNALSVKAHTDLNKKITNGKIFVDNIHYEDKVLAESKELLFVVQHNPLSLHLEGNLGLKINTKLNEIKNANLTNFVLDYSDNIAKIQAKVNDMNNATFSINHISNFSTNVSTGELLSINYKYKDLAKIENQNLKYSFTNDPFELNLTGSMEAIFAPNDKLAKVLHKDEITNIENFKINYLDNKLTFNANIRQQDNKVNIKHISDFDKNISSGSLFVEKFKNENISNMENQNFAYTIEHNPLKAQIKGDFEATMRLKNEETGEIKNKFISLNNMNVSYVNNIMSLNANYLENNNSLFIDNNTNFDTNISRGFVYINHFFIDHNIDLKNELIPYSVDFKDQLKVNIPKYDLIYINDKNKHNLSIGKLNKFLGKMNNIVDKKLTYGNIMIDSTDNLKSLNVVVNDLGINMSSKFFEEYDKGPKVLGASIVQKNPDFIESKVPKISLKLYNSKISLDSIDLNSSVVIGDINKQNIDIQYRPDNEKNIIDFHKHGDNVKLRAKDVSGLFMKHVIKRDIFDDGLFDINLDGNATNLTGSVYVRNTTVKDVKILNNLITFINTTPAIINPILVLPTLFRMNETNFDTNGYYIKDGYLNFDYEYKTKMINLPSYYTKSTMMDFKGYGTIDVGNKTLHLPIDVIFLKDYSKLINKIPIIGYIILGDDKNFVTNVDITGTFDQQDFETHTVKNASKGAINAIKRTFNTPFRLFERMKFTTESNLDETSEELTQDEGK
ncbi:MAG: AsmA-like C-terminal domain-containing protein [Epsilonproteobacteria bacterium]|nr:AsmA-like C-terminal domain-containing protein [Campylobacterota bacterium]